MKLNVDPVLWLLVAMMVFFTLVMIACEVWFVTDSQLFQVFAGVLTALSGAFLGRIKPAAAPSSEGGKSEP